MLWLERGWTSSLSHQLRCAEALLWPALLSLWLLPAKPTTPREPNNQPTPPRQRDTQGCTRPTSQRLNRVDPSREQDSMLHTSGNRRADFQGRCLVKRCRFARPKPRREATGEQRLTLSRHTTAAAAAKRHSVAAPQQLLGQNAQMQTQSPARETGPTHAATNDKHKTLGLTGCQANGL